ncbi:hypothetical protein GYMLUDRAFT_43373 [Collybiopsis luxurians FD-317 M1]|uniref:Septation protein imp2 n=1 Tax=Collybiopsis luxurians FD-317 M1 TaxID=944289 RepID=A0A0D0BAM8_9AGAR|nr:hypothetical protein GYMLUDRAFT_43373 [Collybiopsis luxurians FD-317 M1]
MSVRTQGSVSSLSKYATAKSPGIDLYNGSTSRDFCNSFWGEGDAGVNVLFARMRGAMRTTDSLRNFWKERAAIEEEYARKLIQLAQNAMGKDEIAELRNALDTLQLETEKLANTHLQLASQIRTEMEEPTAALLNKQNDHRRTIQASVEKKYKSKLSSETHVSKAREKYQTDVVRIANYNAQLENQPQSPEADKIRLKLKHAMQTVNANEKDYKAFTKALADMIPGWENDWKLYCDLSQDLEEERLDFMKDNLWAYANAVSTVCVADDESCETIRTVLDQLETDRDIEVFVHEYGTGNSIPNPPEFITGPVNADGSSSRTSLVGNLSSPAVSTRPANFNRTTRRPSTNAPPYNHNAGGSGAQSPPPSQTTLQRDNSAAASTTGGGRTHRTPSPTRSTNVASPPRMTPNNSVNVPPPPPAVPSSPPQMHSQPSSQQMRNGMNGGYGEREMAEARANNVSTASGDSQPNTRRMTLPPQPTDVEVAAPIPPIPPSGERGNTNKILFYVEAMYDYTATIEEEFNFQAGDIIAVTDIPDDGWWSGELLDEARREEGRHVFPSNFVRLF